MWGKSLFCILLISIVASPIAATQSPPSGSPTTQTDVLHFDQPFQTTFTNAATATYQFTISRYSNVTISLETQGNLTLRLPFAYSSGTELFHTNFANYSQSVYLMPDTYEFTITGESGATRDVTIILSEGNPVIDYHNHDQLTAYPIIEGQIIHHVLNYTTTGIANWYSFTISKKGVYRINLENKKDLQSFFYLYSINPYWQSQKFPELNITQTLVRELDPGDYRIKVIMTTAYATPQTFTLWYTSNYDLQAPINQKLDRYIYGVVNSTVVNTYNLQLTEDMAIYFWGRGPIRVSVNGTDVNKQIDAIQNNVFYPSQSEITKMFLYTPAGNYTLVVSSNVTNLVEYYHEIKRLLPDDLDLTSNSQTNPKPLVEYTRYEYTLYIPTDTDWFVIPVIENGNITITHTYGDVVFTVFDDKGNVVLYNTTQTSDGYTNYAFDSISSKYIIEVSLPPGTNFCRYYSFYFNYGEYPTETSSKSKSGFSPVDALLFSLGPVLFVLQRRKFKPRM